MLGMNQYNALKLEQSDERNIQLTYVMCQRRFVSK
jgi:hypothetical protein